MTTVVAVKRPTSGLRISELARAVGVAADTIRYYERVGLLPPPSRTSSGYRTYSVAAIDRMRFIQGAQRLGLTLRDVRDLLAVRDTGVCPCEPAEYLLRRRLDELDRELARLTALRADMLRMAEQLPSAQCPPPTPGRWCPPESGDLTTRPEVPDLTTRPEFPDAMTGHDIPDPANEAG